MKKIFVPLFVFFLMQGLTAFAEPDLATRNDNFKGVSSQGRTENLVNDNVSLLNSKINELERRVNDLERDKRYDQDRIRDLIRDINELKRRF